MRAKAVWISGYRSIVDNGRGHSVVLDLPLQENGENTGPTALELSVMSYVGCVATIFAKVAEKRGIKFSRMMIELDAKKGEKSIESGRAKLIINSQNSKKDVENALRLTLEICPVGVIFDKAGVRIDWEVELLPT